MFILNQMITSLETMKRPLSSDIVARLNFFSAFSRFFFRIDQLPLYSSFINHPHTPLHDQLASLTTFDRLIRIFPDSDQDDFITTLRLKGLSTSQVRGTMSLDVFKTFVATRVEDLQRAVEKRTPNSTANAPKIAHQVLLDDSTSSLGNFSTTHPVSRPSTAWFNSNLMFPCPVEGHDHELNSCCDFF